MTITRPQIYFASIAIILGVSTALAITFGYISPDSWYYILLADALRHGQGCSLHREYLAVYPCGYPTVLALTAPVANPAAFIVSSKIANLLMLCGSFAMIYKASRNILLATAVIINPVTLLIGMYTWSENLELFCLCGVLYGVSRLHESREKWLYVLLGGFLVAGCFARYFFGPFAFLLFLCSWRAYGRATAWRVFPCFAVAGAVYVAYQGLNILITGYATGMPRVAAPESLYLIVSQFIAAFTGNALWIAGALALLIGLGFWQVRLTRAPAEPRDHAASQFVLLAGLAFLVLAFTLRARTLFDSYDTRTIGLGIVLAFAGLAGRYVRLKQPDKWPVAPLIAAGLFSALYADGTSLPVSLIDLLRGGDYHFAPLALDTLQRQGPPIDTVVFFGLPPARKNIGNVDTIWEIHYGRDILSISPMTGPDDPPEAAPAFIKRVAQHAARRCIFDFTPFASMDDFKDYVGSTTQTDQSLGLHPRISVRDNFDPGLKAWLIRVARPGKEVSCADILAAPSTRAILAK